MNPNVHLRRALRDAGRAYQNGLIDLEAVDATRRRVDQIRKRWRALQRRLRRHRKRVVSLDHLARVRAEIARGGVIIAYDCEYVSAGPARQLGIAIWSAGQITTRSYTTPTYDKATATPCRFGPDRIVSSRFLVGLAQRLYRTPGIHVFHSGDAEVSKLALDARNPGHIDTASITHGLFVRGESPSLARLCDHLGLDATGAHNAGNDARFTLDVLIAIATGMETAR